MILYLDTSALIKLYAEEPDTEEVGDAVQKAAVVAISEIGYAEARSALARKERDGAFSTEEHDEAVEQLERDFREIYLLRSVTGEIIALAGDLARQHALRAYDAIHLATALALRAEAREIPPQKPAEQASGDSEREPRVSLMSYDGALIETASNEGFAYERDA